MKKLLVISLFALGFLVSFADNGQKEFILEKFNPVTAENPLTVVESQESSASPTAIYEIVIWITICETFEDGSIGKISYGIPTGNPLVCMDATTLASIKAMYESMYWMMYPNACDIDARETLLDDC